VFLTLSYSDQKQKTRWFNYAIAIMLCWTPQNQLQAVLWKLQAVQMKTKESCDAGRASPKRLEAFIDLIKCVSHLIG